MGEEKWSGIGVIIPIAGQGAPTMVKSSAGSSSSNVEQKAMSGALRNINKPKEPVAPWRRPPPPPPFESARPVVLPKPPVVVLPKPPDVVLPKPPVVLLPKPPARPPPPHLLERAPKRTMDGLIVRTHPPHP